MVDNEKDEMANEVADRVVKKIIYIVIAVVVVLFAYGVFVKTAKLFFEKREKSFYVSEEISELYDKGNWASNLGKYDEALKYYNKIIELDPDIAAVYMMRGSVYGNMGNYNESISDYKKFLTYYPDHAGTYLSMAKTYEEMKDYKNALKKYNSKAIELEPNNDAYYYYRGMFYFWNSHFTGDKSKADFKKGCNLGDKRSCEMLDIYTHKK